MSGLKDDTGKTDLSIVPEALDYAAARALSFGASKYGRNNFRGGISYTRVIGAALRHLKAWNERGDTDSESGLSHLDHAIACLAMLSFYETSPKLKQDFDDRDINKS